MCEYTFTSLYLCILKHFAQKHLKNADASLTRENDHCAGVRCFISSYRQVFSIFSVFSPVAASPLQDEHAL